MTREFLCQKEERDGENVFLVGGTISEDSDFSDLVGFEERVVRIDLGGVDRINSLGVLQWCTTVGEIAAQGKDILLERCPAVMVQQFNMIAYTLKGCVVRSVLVPYYCENCDNVNQTFIEFGEETAVVEEESSCPKCSSTMVCEYLPDNYLSFLQEA